MAITHFIPTLWSETLYSELKNNYVAAKLSNREFEGEIRGEGDRVRICGLNPVTVFNYTRNVDMPTAELLSDNERTLVIDQAKGFNFYIGSDYIPTKYAKQGVPVSSAKINVVMGMAFKFGYGEKKKAEKLEKL